MIGKAATKNSMATDAFTKEWAIQHYDEVLRRIANFPTTRAGRFVLLARFVRKYGLDYKKTKTDFIHILSEQS